MPRHILGPQINGVKVIRCFNALDKSLRRTNLDRIGWHFLPILRWTVILGTSIYIFLKGLFNFPNLISSYARFMTNGIVGYNLSVSFIITVKSLRWLLTNGRFALCHPSKILEYSLWIRNEYYIIFIYSLIPCHVALNEHQRKQIILLLINIL